MNKIHLLCGCIPGENRCPIATHLWDFGSKYVSRVAVNSHYEREWLRYLKAKNS